MQASSSAFCLDELMQYSHTLKFLCPWTIRALLHACREICSCPNWQSRREMPRTAFLQIPAPCGFWRTWDALHNVHTFFVLNSSTTTTAVSEWHDLLNSVLITQFYSGLLQWSWQLYDLALWIWLQVSGAHEALLCLRVKRLILGQGDLCCTRKCSCTHSLIGILFIRSCFFSQF